MPSIKTTKREKELLSEVSQLKKKITKLESEKNMKKSHKIANFFRRATVVLCVIICALMLNLSIAAVWLKRNVVNTDNWVNKTTELLQNESIRQDVSNKLANQIFEATDAQAQIESILPPKVSALSIPLADNLKQRTSQEINKILASDKFLTFWQNANKSAHQGIVESLENGGNAPANNNYVVYISNNELLLNLKPIAENIQTNLENRGLSFVSSADTSKITKTVTITEIKSLPEILTVFDLINKSAKVLPLIGFASGAIAIYLARRKRRVLMSICAVIILFMILNVQAVYLAQYSIAAQVTSNLKATSSDSAQAAFQIITADLVLFSRALMALSIIVLLTALISGPNKYATKFRLWVARVTSGKNPGKFIKFLGANAVAIVTVIASLAVLLIVFPPVSGPTFPIAMTFTVSLVSLWILSLRTAQNNK